MEFFSIPAWIYRELIERFRNAIIPENPVFEFGADFAPAIVKQVAPERWLEQGRETTTWEAFERYLETQATQKTE